MRLKRKNKPQVYKRKIFKTIKIFLILGLCFLILFLGKTLYDGFRQQTLPVDQRVTVGLGVESVLLASYLPEDNSLTFLFIPSEILLPAVGGYGQYKLSSFEPLAKLEKHSFLLQESLSSHLAVPIHGWYKTDFSLSTDSKPKQIRRWFVQKIRQCFLNYSRSKKMPRTNLNRIDFLKLWFWARKSSLKKTKVFTLETYQQEIFLPDNSKAYRLNLAKTDILMQKIFFEPLIKNEGLTIGLANATGNAGLAQEMSRLVTNMGGVVLKIGNWKKKQNFSEIRLKSSSLKETQTVKKLEKIFNCQVKKGDQGEFLVDVLVILGKEPY